MTPEQQIWSLTFQEIRNSKFKRRKMSAMDGAGWSKSNGRLFMHLFWVVSKLGVSVLTVMFTFLVLFVFALRNIIFGLGSSSQLYT